MMFTPIFHTSGGFNDPDMLVVGLEGMFPYGERLRPPLSECQSL